MTPDERVKIEHLRSLVAKEIETLKQERDTARAQVAALAGALRFVAHGENYGCRAVEPCPACYARDALKEAGVGT